MKRIIDGKTYNTETATEIARHQDEGDEAWEALFQSRFGAYFLHGVRETWAEPLSYMTNLPFVEPLSPEQAQKWMEERVEWETDLIEAHFGEMPEAGEAESRFTLRIPQLLKDRIDKLAKMRGQSTNAWIIRCLETCAPVEKMSSLLAVNPDLAAQWHPTEHEGTLVAKYLSEAVIVENLSTGQTLVFASAKKASEFSGVHRSSISLIINGKKRSANNFTFRRSHIADNPDLAAQWHPTKNGTLRPEDVSGGSTKRIWWQCEKDPEHEWSAIAVNRTRRKSGCPYCSGAKSSEDVR